MIAYVKGTVEYIEEDNVVIDVGGIGYNVKVSADTAARMPGVGEQTKLYTYMNVREDAVSLFGFFSRDDLAVFRQCITVSGIGPKGALAILSTLNADSLRFAILSGDAKAISKAPGIGIKTAERLILELRGKIRAEDTLIAKEMADYSGASNVAADTAQKREAVEALVSLGYGQAEALKAVNAIEGIEEMDSGAVLKAALKKMF
ncbi:MAG: Holliday junction branch migration protein RuvA [Lachnospiraceae bacterium]|jgi:Holliday junction DNA helicase RuvA|nr:Holliday junction branch migration protein RuvA [Lachnospiraceae bacterium]